MKDNTRPVWVSAILDNRLTATDYRVFAYLAWRQGMNGQAWPSQPTIASDLGVTERAVRNSTRRLQSRGYLTVSRKPKQGRGHLLGYSVAMSKEGGKKSSPLKAKGGTPVPPSEDERRKKSTIKGGTQRPTNTIQEHSTIKNESSGKKFTPPTSDEVRAYAEQIGFISLDSERFVDFYSSKGWLVGKAKMRDWKAAVRTWKRRDDGENTNGKIRQNGDFESLQSNIGTTIVV